MSFGTALSRAVTGRVPLGAARGVAPASSRSTAAANWRALGSNPAGSASNRRSFFGSSNPFSRAKPAGTTIQSLAQREYAANSRLNDPAAQAALYRELLEAQYPSSVVHRYETPGVARNAETERSYLQASREVAPERAAAVAPGSTVRSSAFNTSNSAPNAAKAGGSAGSADVAESSARVNAQNTFSSGNRGGSTDPVHVVVSETPSAVSFKWSKWAIPVMLAVWVVFTATNFLSDSAGVFRGLGGGVEGPGGPGSSKMDEVRGEKSTVRFKDVLGADEARNELEEIVEFSKDPAKFTGLGGKSPKGVLLTGPPGTGKTSSARAVAGEAGVPFFFMSGSEFDESYVGVGAKRVRESFAAARKKAPAIVFIDELDAIGGKRNPKDQAYSKQTSNQSLVDSDGFNQTEGVIFIAATNFPEMLDKALTRPGRFDKTVNVELPDVRGRAAILQHYVGKIEVDKKDVNVMNIARGTPGFSGADSMNLVNQAAIYAASQRARCVNSRHLEWAKDKISLGAERKSMVMTEETRNNTAYHEAGHAIMAMFTPGATPLYKATISPRGGALGITFQSPELDKYDQTKAESSARLDVCMGGKVAEESIHGRENVTSGCHSDSQNATSVARAMVTGYGMSDKIGPISSSEQWQDWSPETRYLAEQEIRGSLTASMERTRRSLEEKHLESSRLAEGLIKYETLDKADIERVVRGEPSDKEPHVTNTIVKGDDIRDQRGPSRSAPPVSAPTTAASEPRF